jgi:type IV pilus assembly protein PilX
MNQHFHSRVIGRRAATPQRAPRGISLIASLILLALTSLLAVGALRAVTVQTRITGAAQDRGVAFQAAEAALRDAERSALAAGAAGFPSSGCSSGRCAAPALTDTVRWLNANFTGWQTSTAAVPAEASTTAAVAENLGESPNWLSCENEVPRQPNCMTTRFRITSRSGAANRATVMLQTHVASDD